MANGAPGRLAGGVIGLSVLISACASMDGNPALRSWRKVNQAEQRFAVFISEPGVREGDTATFRMRFVYMPGAVTHEGADVAWQEYHAMTVDCARNLVRVGPRTRHAPDGHAIASDDDQTFSDIRVGTAADDAAKAKCRDEVWVGDVTFPEAPGWMDEARAHIAKTSPPRRL